MDNVVRCRTLFDPSDKKAPFKTVCVFKGKTYKRRLDSTHRERQNVREITDYLMDRGHEFENIVYPEIDMG